MKQQGAPRRVATLVAFVGLVAALISSPARAAQASPSLTGEDLSSTTPALIVSGSCNPAGNSTFQFSASGVATGPYAGTFTESGSFTIGPQSETDLGVLGPVIDFNAGFEITSVAGTVQGNKQFTLNPENLGGCNETGGQILVHVDYTATIGSDTDSGHSVANFNFLNFTPAEPGEGQEFNEHFTSTAPPPPPNPPLKKQDCKKGGYVTHTDDNGRPLKNQGDCIGVSKGKT